MLKKFSDILLKIQQVFFTAVMAAMLLILSAHVIMRFAFHRPIIWTDEVVTMLQGVLAFAGIGYCFHKSQHIEVEVAYDRMLRPLQRACDILSNVIVLFCLVILIKYSAEYVVYKNIPMNTIPWMKQSWIYLFITIGFVIAFVYVILRLVGALKEIADLHKSKREE